MKSLIHYYKVLKQMSFEEVIDTVLNLLIKPCIGFIQQLKDKVISPIDEFLLKKAVLKPLFDTTENLSFQYDENLNYVCKRYMNHEFDLLGSGWIKNGFLNNSIGLQGYKYDSLELNRTVKEDWLSCVLAFVDVKSAKQVFKHVSSEYIPIDWQKDFKTGYRWSSKNWYRPIKYINSEITPGVDIKIPWELSRLQHLTRMGYYCNTLGISTINKEKIALEYQNQCLDFIAQNPPRKGVNWYCTMDVGIRTANLALSYSLFKLCNCKFNAYFENRLTATLFSHCNFIRKNLEWSSTCRSNHYLADICGLLFGAAVLPNCKEKNKWLHFARNEIEKEIELQFHKDGSNFESSVAYHRLSAEMIVYSVALIQKLSKDGYVTPISQKCINLLYKIGRFSEDTILPDGTFYQCGDNDSGRFFNITPIGEYLTIDILKQKYQSLKDYKYLEGTELYFDELMNSSDALLTAINTLLGSSFKISNDCPAEKNIVKLLASNQLYYEIEDNNCNYTIDKSAVIDYHMYYSEKKYYIPDNALDDLEYIEYKDFGLSIFKSSLIFLAINWTDNGQNGNAGHTHNDKLSFELWINNEPIIRDPGTFVYTPLPKQRNKFRSVKAHNTMQIDKEQNEFLTLFSMKNQTKSRLIEKNSRSLSVSVNYDNIFQIRRFQFLSNALVITDKSTNPFTIDFSQHMLTAGYGKLLYDNN